MRKVKIDPVMIVPFIKKANTDKSHAANISGTDNCVTLY